MSDIKDQIVNVAAILVDYDLDIQLRNDKTFELYDSKGKPILTEIADFNELHSALLGFEEGYKASNSNKRKVVRN